MTAPSRSAKQVTRRALRDARTSRAAGSSVDRRQVAGALADHVGAALAAALDRRPQDPGDPVGGPAVVAAYRSLPGEPGTDALRRRLLSDGQRVILPVLLPDLDLDWVLDPGPPDRGDPLRPDGERLGPGAPAGCALVLVPALAVDRSGTRLGQGGGSYDRALARLASMRPRPLVLAVLHDDEVLDGPLPREPHDEGVDGALTPSGVLLLGAAPAR